MCAASSGIDMGIAFFQNSPKLLINHIYSSRTAALPVDKSRPVSLTNLKQTLYLSSITSQSLLSVQHS